MNMRFFSSHIQSEPGEGAFSQAIGRLSEARPFLTLCLIGGVLYLTWLTAEPLRTHIEGYRVEAAWEMLHSGDMAVPTLNGRPYLAKPPFQYWLIALVSLPFGEVTLLTARMVSGASVITVMCMLFAWGRRIAGSRAAFYAAMVYALAPLIIEKGPRAELESLLAALTTASILLLWRACENERGWVITLSSGIALGAANLTKGPVPWLIFICAWLGLIAASRGTRKRIAVRGLAALGVSLLCVTPWVIALLARFGPGDLYRIVYDEVLERTVSEREIIHEPFWYYAHSLLKGFAPWSLLMPALSAWRGVTKALNDEQRRAAGMMIGWSLGAALLFSLFSGKETRYLISTYPAWAMWMAWAWTEATQRGWLAAYRRFLTIAVYWGAPVLLLAACFILPGFFQPFETYWLGYAGFVLLINAVGLMYAAQRFNLKTTMIAALALLVIAFRMSFVGTYLTERSVSYPFASIGEQIQQQLEADEPMALVGIYRAYLQFAVKHPFLYYETGDEFQRALQDGELDGRLALLQPKHVESLHVNAPELLARMSFIQQWKTARDEFELYRIN
ncbi:MAG: hypothetical protein GC154_14275 [bacterium]|nr:hypothetical protein [bacterium]